jgi:hypothetical protein
MLVEEFDLGADAVDWRLDETATSKHRGLSVNDRDFIDAQRAASDANPARATVTIVSLAIGAETFVDENGALLVDAGTTQLKVWGTPLEGFDALFAPPALVEWTGMGSSDGHMGASSALRLHRSGELFSSFPGDGAAICAASIGASGVSGDDGGGESRRAGARRARVENVHAVATAGDFSGAFSFRSFTRVHLLLHTRNCVQSYFPRCPLSFTHLTHHIQPFKGTRIGASWENTRGAAVAAVLVFRLCDNGNAAECRVRSTDGNIADGSGDNSSGSDSPDSSAHDAAGEESGGGGSDIIIIAVATVVAILALLLVVRFLRKRFKKAKQTIGRLSLSVHHDAGGGGPGTRNRRGSRRGSLAATADAAAAARRGSVGVGVGVGRRRSLNVEKYENVRDKQQVKVDAENEKTMRAEAKERRNSRRKSRERRKSRSRDRQRSVDTRVNVNGPNAGQCTRPVSMPPAAGMPSANSQRL